MSIELQPIAIIHTPYTEKFSVPRQPELVQHGTGILELLPPYNIPESVRGLEQFSHLWLIFQFDRIPAGKWSPTVRPPRLGGNQRVGVFASRSTHRPNPLGLSKVRLDHIEITQGKVLLHLGSVDLVNGTPIFDIKPYLAYADSEPLAQSSFAQTKPEVTLQVIFSPLAQQQATTLATKYPHLISLIEEVLQQDPRPAYQKQQLSERVYGMTLWDINIQWRMSSVQVVEVLSLVKR
ncbi:tRNA (adenine(37)-N6)-methyltransferase [Gallibacterium salpingitidis]|uniref:tRNA (Adenine(37)-N6)-methyltransferase n=1 Tax=Gallibacterium salpingitidis TaxID=505341 RepID=A0AB36E428_9PAST|nr:tRNA (N6-threonylcarbamoyladenosine(37)-N6)-methyltransferase TrmO [Gallibacterium salpingitidis]OBX09825.1 tRNA (adenine(37)-N6)-methyltransferase [Gallibacterium salpingitidis]OBX11343.1 tRNA (adenine(37)-N6)-methyltransferase [Gallibacterium salpingitidis]WKS99221.1 tRNA (N6-threonylcarbamoyladenosine(37)-N6)-methyltransferase TrmO [Gallibacterium salpingitidis]